MTKPMKCVQAPTRRLRSVVFDDGTPCTVVFENGDREQLDAEQVKRVQAAVQAALGLTADHYTPNEAARVLGVSRPTILGWMEDGLLRDEPVNTHHRIPAEDVEQLARQRADAGRKAVQAVSAARSEQGTPQVEAALARARRRVAERDEKR